STVPLAILRRGESIGLSDTGFFSTTGKRTATVRAVKPITLLKINIEALHNFLQKNDLESEMHQAAEQMLRMKLIKQCLPFTKISHERLRWLCEKIECQSVAANTIIFNQGEKGDRCYLIQSGKVEIIATEPNGQIHQLAVLKPPTLFGEATLITQEPRNATARTLEDSQLLVLKHSYLSELWEKEKNVAEMFMTLMVDRSRPIRNKNIAEYPRSTDDGQTVVILKNPSSANYFKLSQEGWFVWKQLNGQQTLFEITLGLANQYQVFSPNMVTALISKLAREDFIENVNVESLSKESESATKKWVGRIQSILEFRLLFKTADYWITKLYNKGVYLLFSKMAQLLLAILAIGGFVAFLATESHVIELMRSLHDSWLLFICMIPLSILVVLLHELGHAFGTKAYGREVHSMGIGWNWTMPVAFTDTTDMWLDTRKHRIAVNAAGIYANILSAGICALLIFVVPSAYIKSFLWLFALTTYIKGFAMLNPSQDVDGYYILMDIFDKAHLRRDATAWFIHKLPYVFRKPFIFRRHKPEVFYWVTCIIFLALTAIITLYVQGFILQLLGMQPPNMFTALVLPTITVITSSLSLISDIKKQD
ncbi:MAG TPA: cyclic nucleotide-binding domain-containing protein, partial [Gammaproteobacteria bacterium]|nr:cyclic nucleotide-binding domain-containing protein [Gammaproteobacteria bacterium]